MKCSRLHALSTILVHQAETKGSFYCSVLVVITLIAAPEMPVISLSLAG